MNLTLLKRIVCWAMVVAWMILIFSFSSQTSKQSVSTSNSVIKTIATILKPDFEQLDKTEQDRIYSLYTHFVRKLGHFWIYSLLGFLVSLALLNYPLSSRRNLLYSSVICTLYAASDEIHQSFVPGRSPGIFDVVIDTAGAVLGCCIIICILYGIKRLKNKAHK